MADAERKVRSVDDAALLLLSQITAALYEVGGQYRRNSVTVKPG